MQTDCLKLFFSLPFHQSCLSFAYKDESLPFDSMEVSDGWRDFLCERPTLHEMREKIKADPLADLDRQIEILKESGEISHEKACLLLS